jgi:hypothetical protein
MRHRIVCGMLLFCAGLLPVMPPAKADSMHGVTFTVTNPDLSGSPGDTLTWNYLVSNNNPAGLDVFALDVNAAAGFADGAPDQSVFDHFGPANIIANGASFTGTLFSFLSDPTVPNSTNTGSFLLTVILQDGQGNFVGDPFDLNEKYSATISTATNVSEPGTLLLLASGLLAGFLVVRRAAQ